MMVMNLENVKIKTKFAIFGGIILIVSLVSIFAMLEIAKTTYFQKLERDHAENAVYLDWKSSELFRALKEKPDERDTLTASYITVESDNPREMGIVQLIGYIKTGPVEGLELLNFIETMLFKLIGFGEVFDLIDKDIINLDDAEKILMQYRNKEVTDQEFFKLFSTKLDDIKKGGTRFAQVINNVSVFVKRMMISVSIFSMFVMLGFLFLVAKAITTPILKITEISTQVSEGDLTKKTAVKSKDEIGKLSESFDDMVTKTKQVIEGVVSKSVILTDSSSSLASLSEHMSQSSQNSSDKANTVAAAAEEMSTNMNSVSAATEQAATNVSMVAAAMEQMSATINEIAQNTEKASSITGKAVEQSKSTSDKIDELGQAADKIGKVTETITEISEQTNLLALNATIEAARAGEAGKGFAVVANEIKELAKQTAEATREIKARIEGIQNTTAGTVTEIEQISQVISDINEIVVTIATAVEEQSVTSKDVAENVAQASLGIQEVTENVAQSSTVSGEIAINISEVNQTASEISNSGSQLNMSAQELGNLSAELKEMVSIFKV